MSSQNVDKPNSAIVDRRSGLTVGAAVIIANLSNYGFQILTGRLLNVDEYGLLAGFMSAITIIAVSTSALQTTAARTVAVGNNRPDRRSLLDHLTRTAVVFALTTGLIIIALSPLISRFLNIGLLPIVFLGVYVLPSVLDSIAAGRLQGARRFRALARYTAAQAVAKLAVAAAIIGLGYRVVGLVAGLVLTCGSVALAGLLSTREVGAIDTHVLGPEVRRGFFAFLSLWIMMSVDFAFARAFFAPDAAGVYAAAAVLGKAVLWLPTMVTQLLFPHLAERSVKGQGAGAVMSRAALLVIGVSGASVAVLYVFGHQIFSLLYGSRYNGAADISWQIGLAMIPLALVNLFLFHFLARGQGQFLSWMLIAVICEVGALLVGPKTGHSYAVTIGATGSLLLLALMPPAGWRRLRRRL